MATTLHQDGATGQRRKIPHTSESVTETPPFPKAAQPLRASHPVCPLGPPSLPPLWVPQNPPLSPSAPCSQAPSSSLPHICPGSPGSPSLSPCKPLTLRKHIAARSWPHCVCPSAVHRLLSWGLPAPCGRFLQRQPGTFPITAVLLGAGTGGLLAVGECGAGVGVGPVLGFWLDPAPSGLFQLLVNPMDIYEDEKMVALYSLVGERWPRMGSLGRPVEQA